MGVFYFCDFKKMGLEAVATPAKNELGKKPVEAGFSSQGGPERKVPSQYETIGFE